MARRLEIKFKPCNNRLLAFCLNDLNIFIKLEKQHNVLNELIITYMVKKTKKWNKKLTQTN